ncbi:hypothetical protein Hypma_008157 [Hypsizygus marmoreus]|uniref:Uncharacterized protein n=1 Tax=Hypsizygus marmoreus TaxID=39966 RepID=A0A369K167_HYPMA|nr:hypothetical protein Hypma_008157 [Hypsizygus marmoreus]
MSRPAHDAPDSEWDEWEALLVGLSALATAEAWLQHGERLAPPSPFPVPEPEPSPPAPSPTSPPPAREHRPLLAVHLPCSPSPPFKHQSPSPVPEDVALPPTHQESSAAPVLPL